MTTAAQAVVFKRCAVVEALSGATAIGQRKATGNPVRSVLGHFNGGRPNLINLLAGLTALDRETKGSRGTGSDGVNNVV
jgi:hypothetical protein